MNPRITVEAVVMDKNDSVVAAMVTAEKAGLGGQPFGYNVNGMVDRVVAALDSELMKGR